MTFPCHPGWQYGDALRPAHRHCTVTQLLRWFKIFARLLTKVISRSRHSPGVVAPLRTKIVPLTAVWNPLPPPPSLPPPPLEKSPNARDIFGALPSRLRDHTPCYHHISSGVLLWLKCESISCLRLFRAELHIEVQQRLKRDTPVRQLLDLWACTSSTKQKNQRPQSLYKTST